MQGFEAGSMVLLMLQSPQQKYFGVLLKLAEAGVELRGFPLESLEDLARQIRAGERAGVSTLFFPMHRVERMELDASVGELPSLAEIALRPRQGAQWKKSLDKRGAGEHAVEERILDCPEPVDAAAPVLHSLHQHLHYGAALPYGAGTGGDRRT